MGLFDWATSPPKKKVPEKMNAKAMTYKQRMDAAIDGPPDPPKVRQPTKPKGKKISGY